MRLVTLLLSILVVVVNSFTFTMDVLISDEDPAATCRLISLQASDPGHDGLKKVKMSLEAKKIMTDERQPLIKKRWTEDGASNPKECTICLLKYNKKERVKLALLCDSEKKVLHAFCKKCLTEWAGKKENCPTCSRPFKLSEVVKATQTSLSSSLRKMILKWCCCTYFIDDE